jgi:hypothetical protein
VPISSVIDKAPAIAAGPTKEQIDAELDCETAAVRVKVGGNDVAVKVTAAA